MIPMFSPGIRWYADEIRAGRPFSFIRYGEGEWRFIVPQLPEKTGRDGFWRLREAQDALRHTLLNCHSHDRYFPAISHQQYLHAHKWLSPVKKWLRDSKLDWIRWHHGLVWRAAVERNKMSVVVSAIREQRLPVIVVGPKAIRSVGDKLRAAKFIQIHPTQAYWDRAKIEREILDFGKPALISFSAGCNTKMMIHSLFPQIGHHSIMLDFGAAWEGLCGHKTRPYHMSLTAERIRRNWEGR